MPTKSKPYNTVTAEAINEHVNKRIMVQSRTAAHVMPQLIGRANQLNDEGPGNIAAHTAGELVAHLLEGNGYDPAEWAARSREAALEHYQHQAEQDFLKQALNQLRNITFRQEAETRADDELTYLNEQLTALVDDVRRIAADYPQRVTLEALAADTKKAPGLHAQGIALAAYETIRQRQWRVHTKAATSTGGRGDREAVQVSGRLADALDAETYWLDIRQARAEAAERHQRERGGLRRMRLTDAQMQFFAETPEPVWPSSAGEPAHPAWPITDDSLDRWEYLVWIATNARPWVPTLDQLHEAHEANAAAVEIARDEDFKPVRSRFYTALQPLA